MNKFSEIYLESLKEVVRRATAACREQVPANTEPPVYSEKAQKIITAIQGSGWAAQRKRALATMMSVLLDEDVNHPFVERPTAFPFVLYAMVVPTRNRSGQAYTLGSPYLVTHVQRIGLPPDSLTSGRYMDAKMDGSRPATDRNRHAWFPRVPENNVPRLPQTL